MKKYGHGSPGGAIVIILGKTAANAPKTRSMTVKELPCTRCRDSETEIC